jgi:hypothetical protein
MITDMVLLLQQALLRAKAYDEYENNREKEALVFAIERALLHAKNQLI